MCRVKSMTTASPTACPARALPPPRGRTGTPNLRADFVHSRHIVRSPRVRDRQGHDLIVAGIRAVERARHAVGSGLLPPDGGPQVMQQFVNLHGLAFR